MTSANNFGIFGQPQATPLAFLPLPTLFSILSKWVHDTKIGKHLWHKPAPPGRLRYRQRSSVISGLYTWTVAFGEDRLVGRKYDDGARVRPHRLLRLPSGRFCPVHFWCIR